MGPLFRTLGFASLAVALLGAACETPPPPPPVARPAPPPLPPAPVLPPRVLTICERDANPTTGAEALTIASFETFSRGWIETMKRIGAARGPARRKRIRDIYEMQLRATGSAVAPWVGVLKYCEIALSCTSTAESSCEAVETTVVTEVFRYQAGKWVY